MEFKKNLKGNKEIFRLKKGKVVVNLVAALGSQKKKNTI